MAHLASGVGASKLRTPQKSAKRGGLALSLCGGEQNQLCHNIFRDSSSRFRPSHNGFRSTQQEAACISPALAFRGENAPMDPETLAMLDEQRAAYCAMMQPVWAERARESAELAEAMEETT